MYTEEQIKLINVLKPLYLSHCDKLREFSSKAQNEEVGILTREAVIMAKYIPEMQRLNITFEDLT